MIDCYIYGRGSTLEKIMQDKKAVERAAVLEKRIIELQNQQFTAFET